ncbi:hypothetical protein [Photobacterium nomapromontoriensis]|uniref:hypothetical protein n=1 Tax=Photobacterium nomapromontoriensis TaxID=2910237 RepID=UPI003D0DE436
MKKQCILFLALALTACGGDNSSDDSSGGKHNAYTSKQLGPVMNDNTARVAIIADAGAEDTAVISARPEVTFNQSTGELTIRNGNGIRHAEATFLLSNGQAVTAKSCGFLETKEQNSTGCMLAVSGANLSSIYLSEIQLFDRDGNLVSASIL